MVYIRDVGHVRDGFPPQTNIVRVDGQRASLLSVIKTGDASTLDIIKGLRAKIDLLKSQLPPAAQDHAARRPVDLRPGVDRAVSCAKASSPPASPPS